MKLRLPLVLGCLVVFFACIPTVDIGNFGPVHVRLYEVLAVLLFSVEIVKGSGARRNDPRVRRIFLFATLFLLVCFLSVVSAAYPVITIKQGLLVLAFLVTGFSIGLSLRGEQEFKYFFLVLLIGSFIAYLFGYLQVLFPDSIGAETLISRGLTAQYTGYFFRPMSFFAEGNEFGVFIIFGSPFFVSGYLYGREVWMRRTSALLLMFMLPLLFLNDSRGSIAALVVVVLLAVIIGRRYIRARRKKSHRRLWGLALMTVLAIFVAVFYLSPMVPTFYQLSPDQWVVGRLLETGTSRDLTLVGRFLVMREGVDAFLSHPLLGVGLGNVFTVISQFGYVPVYSAVGGLVDRGNATTANFVVDILAELGLLGITAFAALIYYVLKLSKLSRQIFVSNDGFYFAFGAFLSFVGILVNSLSYDAIYTPYFWIVIGFIIGSYRTAPRQNWIRYPASAQGKREAKGKFDNSQNEIDNIV